MISKWPQFSDTKYNTDINLDGNNEFLSFIFLDLLKLYENYNIQEKYLSEKMNKINVHLSNKHLDMKINFNTLQYLQELEQNNLNHEQNTGLLYLSNSKNDWFGLCHALLDEDFDNKVCFENNNIKAFHHAFLYHRGYRNKHSLIKEIQKIKTGKEQNQTQKQSSINNNDHPKDDNHNKNEDKNIETKDDEIDNNNQNEKIHNNHQKNYIDNPEDKNQNQNED